MSNYTVTTSFVGMSIPTTVVEMLVVYVLYVKLKCLLAHSPTCFLTCLLAYLPTCLRTYLHNCPLGYLVIGYLLTSLFAYLHICFFTYLFSCFLITSLFASLLHLSSAQTGYVELKLGLGHFTTILGGWLAKCWMNSERLTSAQLG